ncbi:SDR family oxidoreductase [Xanthobacter aminoxidans]|uniref:SDR family oxidoreductase n=1 Tax=Xanthobacter aminoxidans TaxID=186280 RepID=UPI00372D090A
MIGYRSRASNAATPAKAALNLWAKGLSCDVACYGITVNCIAPAPIKSEQTMTRLHPTEAARRLYQGEYTDRIFR